MGIIFLANKNSDYTGSASLDNPVEYCPHVRYCDAIAFFYKMMCLSAGGSQQYCDQIYWEAWDDCMEKCHSIETAPVDDN